jgi:hypothetical protein
VTLFLGKTRAVRSMLLEINHICALRGSVHGPDRAVGAFFFFFFCIVKILVAKCAFVPLPSESRSTYVFFFFGFFFEKFSSSDEMCSSDTLRYRPSTNRLTGLPTLNEWAVDTNRPII